MLLRLVTCERELRAVSTTGDSISQAIPLVRRESSFILPSIRRYAIRPTPVIPRSRIPPKIHPPAKVMATIDDVRAKEKKLQVILDAIRDAPMQDLNRLNTELKTVSDDYAKVITELTF